MFLAELRMSRSKKKKSENKKQNRIVVREKKSVAKGRHITCALHDSEQQKQ